MFFSLKSRNSAPEHPKNALLKWTLFRQNIYPWWVLQFDLKFCVDLTTSNSLWKETKQSHEHSATSSGLSLLIIGKINPHLPVIYVIRPWNQKTAWKSMFNLRVWKTDLFPAIFAKNPLLITSLCEFMWRLFTWKKNLIYVPLAAKDFARQLRSKPTGKMCMKN